MPEVELMIAVYKRAMDDIHAYLEAESYGWGDKSEGLAALQWIETMSGSFSLVAAALDWHPTYLRRVSLEYVNWWRNGSDPASKPTSIGYNNAIKTRSDKLRQDPNRKKTKISECGYCGSKFLNKYRAGRWRTYCDQCVKNKRDTYASLNNLFEG